MSSENPEQPTFQQLITGQVLEDENPFYHAVVGADWAWRGGDTLFFDDNLASRLTFIGRTGAQALGFNNEDRVVELTVKAGFDVRMEIKNAKWGSFTVGINEEEYAAWGWESHNTGLGGDSVVSFIMRAGSSIFYTPKGDEISASGKEILAPSETGIAGLTLILTGAKDSPNRILKFDQTQSDIFLTLESYAKSESGGAGTGLTSEDTDATRDDELKPNPTGTTETIGSGLGWSVRIAQDDESWVVYNTGLRDSAYEDRTSALNRAIALTAELELTSYTDPNGAEDSPNYNAYGAVINGVFSALPFVLGIVLVGMGVKWIVTKSMERV